MSSNRPWWVDVAKDLIMYAALLCVLDYVYTVSLAGRKPSDLMVLKMAAWLRDRWPRIETPSWVSLLSRRDLPAEDSPQGEV